MKRVMINAIAVALSMSATNIARAEFSANVALTSDYVFRGISQTDEQPAIQGGFDYNHASGLYAGIWGSNVDFGEDTGDGLGRRAQMELDLYAGFASKLANRLGYDVGVIYYSYPGAGSGRNYNFTEVYGKLSYDFGPAAANVGVNYSNDFFASSGNAAYYYGEVEVPVGKRLKVGAHIGRQNIDDNNAYGTPDYTDYRIGLSADYAGFGFGLHYTDTSLNKSDCFGGSDLCDGRLVFSVSKNL